MTSSLALRFGTSVNGGALKAPFTMHVARKRPLLIIADQCGFGMTTMLLSALTDLQSAPYSIYLTRDVSTVNLQRRFPAILGKPIILGTDIAALHSSYPDIPVVYDRMLPHVPNDLGLSMLLDSTNFVISEYSIVSFVDREIDSERSRSFRDHARALGNDVMCLRTVTNGSDRTVQSWNDHRFTINTSARSVK